MNAAEALQEFLRPPQPVRNLKREEAILGQADVSRIVIAPGIENEREEIAVYRWGDGDRRVLFVHWWAGKKAQIFALIRALPDRGFFRSAFYSPAHRNSSRGFSHWPALCRAALLRGERGVAL